MTHFILNSIFIDALTQAKSSIDYLNALTQTCKVHKVKVYNHDDGLGISWKESKG